MALFSIPELREETRKRPIVAIAHSNLGPGDATFHLDQWAMELMAYARALQYPIIDIGGADLVYDRMTKILTETKPALLVNFSHGCKTYLIGNDGRCSLTRGQEDVDSCGVCGMPSNLKSISGTAIIAYSCNSAYQLGKCAITYGAPMYVGFTDNLLVVSDRFGTQNLFKDSLLPLAKRILEGWNIGAAVEATRTDLLNYTKTYKPVELISVPMWYNKKYLTLLGDSNWKLI